MSVVGVEALKKHESRLLSEHNEQISQLSEQLHEKDLQIKQYETDIQVPSVQRLYSKCTSVLVNLYYLLVTQLFIESFTSLCITIF